MTRLNGILLPPLARSGLQSAALPSFRRWMVVTTFSPNSHTKTKPKSLSIQLSNFPLFLPILQCKTPTLVFLFAPQPSNSTPNSHRRGSLHSHYSSQRRHVQLLLAIHRSILSSTLQVSSLIRVLISDLDALIFSMAHFLGFSWACSCFFWIVFVKNFFGANGSSTLLMFQMCN